LAGQVADWLVEVAVALAVFDRTGSALASALVFVALRVLPAGCLPVAMGRSLAALAALRALAVLALALGIDALPVWALLGIGLADGLGSLAGRAGSRAATAQILGAPERVRAGNAVLNLAFSVAAAAAPVGAGALVSGFGPAAALAPAAALLGLAALAVVRVRGRERRRSRRGSGLLHLARSSGSAHLLAAEALLLVLFTAAVPVELPYVKQSLGAGDAGYGALLTAWGIGMVGGSVAFAALSRTRLPLLAGAATLAVATAYAVMGVAPSLLVAAAGALLGGFGNGVQWVAVASWVQRRAPADLAVRLPAVLEAIAALAPGAGFLLGGAAVTVLDPRTCLVALAAAIAGVAFFAAKPVARWRMGPRGRRLVAVKVLAALCALLAVSVGTIGSADAARKHKRPFCSPRNTKVLKHTSVVRILYVEHPADEDLYGTPATVYACFPARKRRTKLLEIPSSEIWSPKIMALTDRYFAVFATTEDIVCEKYAQPDCTDSYVAGFKLSNGKERCFNKASASALGLTSHGWIAWLSGSGPSTLSGCDSGGTRTLDQGAIDPASVLAAGASVQWTRDGQPQSADLR
jgi:hypothetical protein